MAAGGLFSDEELYGENNEPLQQGEEYDITTTILYMSVVELKEFKQLAKSGIKKMFGQEFQQKGNLTDFILALFKMYDNGWKESNTADERNSTQAKVQETPEPEPSGSVEGEVPFGW